MYSFLYNLTLYLHIISAVISVGPFFLLLFTVKKIKVVQDDELFPYLHTVSQAVWLAKHAGHILTVTGIVLIMIGPWSWKTSWIAVTLLILLVSLFFLASAFTPTVNKLRKLPADRSTLVQSLRRAIWIYLCLLLLILWLMVAKPTFW